MHVSMPHNYIPLCFCITNLLSCLHNLLSKILIRTEISMSLVLCQIPMVGNFDYMF